jgi:putative endonuclease
MKGNRNVSLLFLVIFSMPAHFVFILFSEQTDKYYIGQTEDIGNRLLEHNSHSYKDSFTKIGSDWKLKTSPICDSKRQAIKIEPHIKKTNPENTLRILLVSRQ